MQLLHLLGHRHSWNIESYYENEIGEGFVFCSYSFDNNFFEREKINGHKTTEILKKSLIDLQYFGKKASGNIGKGKLTTYPFHPANVDDDDRTSAYIQSLMIAGIQYQLDLNIKNIIIPIYYEDENFETFIGEIKTINKWLSKNKVDGIRYFMSLPLANHILLDSDKIEKLLFALTDMKICFDGYYIISESKPDTRQKINIDIKFIKNLSRIFNVLKKQNFITIYSYANWDAMIYLALSDIDYITISTFENLRNFNIKRFVVSEDGGPSKGWYFSEKLLNFIKSQYIELIRERDCIELISNERNIYSDIILNKDFPWDNNKTEVHKNYLIAINKLLTNISAYKNFDDRKKFVLRRIDNAISIYNELENNKIYLLDESRNYHLETWKAFLMSR